MDAKNIFELIGEFSEGTEDHLTASFGTLLGNDEALLLAFLRQIGIRLDARKAKQVKIQTQMQETENRLDLILSLEKNFLIYIEVKITAAVTKNQLTRYLKQLLTKNHKEKRFILLTVGKEEKFLRAVVRKTHFKQKNAVNLLWTDVLKLLLEERPARGREFLVQEFIERWKHTMEGELDPRDHKLCELEEVLVVVVGYDCMEYIKRHGVYVPPGGSHYKPAQFVAFYISHPLKELRYLARIDKIVTDVHGRKLPKGYYPKKLFHHVIYVQKPIELANRLTRGKQNMNIWGGRFTTLTKLLNVRSRTLDDLRK